MSRGFPESKARFSESFKLFATTVPGARVGAGALADQEP